MIDIEAKNTFDDALISGISLFLGAGFSVLANDGDRRMLPCGDSLLGELKNAFPRIAKQQSLDKASTVLEKSTDKSDFHTWLTKRFTVQDFDSCYNALTAANVKSIYSTNIDDLIFAIWDKNTDTQSYIYNTLEKGTSPNRDAIHYNPLHGCVRNSDRPYIFSKTRIATAYSQNGSWGSLQCDARNRSMLFWGWSFNDSDVIEALYSSVADNINEDNHRWIVLKDPDDGEKEFYKSLNFNIITSDTRDLLNYIEAVCSNVIVIGIPVSGKTTLMMQLAAGVNVRKEKHILYTPSIEEVKKYKSMIHGEQVLVFIDNCLSDYRVLLELSSPNLQIVGFDRDSNYESIEHKLASSRFKYEMYDVTEIDDRDVAKLFLMTCYVGSCGAPVSYDMIYSYENADNWKAVYNNIDKIGALVKECCGEDISFLPGIIKPDQDYYRCRTSYLASLVVNNPPNLQIMREMLGEFVDNVPVYKRGMMFTNMTAILHQGVAALGYPAIGGRRKEAA